MIFLLFSTSSIDMGYYNLVDKHDRLVKRAEENRFTFFNSQENTDPFPFPFPEKRHFPFLFTFISLTNFLSLSLSLSSHLPTPFLFFFLSKHAYK